jgi:hypothetical protein
MKGKVLECLSELLRASNEHAIRGRLAACTHVLQYIIERASIGIFHEHTCRQKE